MKEEVQAPYIVPLSAIWANAGFSTRMFIVLNMFFVIYGLLMGIKSWANEGYTEAMFYLFGLSLCNGISFMNIYSTTLSNMLSDQLSKAIENVDRMVAMMQEEHEKQTNNQHNHSGSNVQSPCE